MDNAEGKMFPERTFKPAEKGEKKKKVNVKVKTRLPGQQWFWAIVDDTLFPCEAVNYNTDTREIEFYYDFGCDADGEQNYNSVDDVEDVVGKQAVRAIAKFIAGNLSVNPNEVFDFDSWYNGAKLVRGTKEDRE